MSFGGTQFNPQELNFGPVKCEMHMACVSGEDLVSRWKCMSGPKKERSSSFGMMMNGILGNGAGWAHQRESMAGYGAWGEALSSNCPLGRIPRLHCCITNHYKTQ